MVGRSRYSVIVHIGTVITMTVTLQIRHRAAASDGAGLARRIHPGEATRLAWHDGNATLFLLLFGIFAPHLDIGIQVAAVVVHQVLEIAVAQHIAAHDIAIVRQAYRIFRLKKTCLILHTWSLWISTYF